MFKIKINFLFYFAVIALLSSCNSKVTIKNENASSLASQDSSITSIAFSDLSGRLTFSGSNLNYISSGYIEGDFGRIELSIITKTTTSLIAETSSLFTPATGKSYDLVLNVGGAHLRSSSGGSTLSFAIVFSPSTGTIEGSYLADRAVTGSKIAQGGATHGQLLRWNDTLSTWEPSDDHTPDVSEGSVTMITPGTGFSSSTPITLSGTLNVDVGTSAGKIVAVNSLGKLPSVGGVNLTRLPADISIDTATLQDGTGDFNLQNGTALNFKELVANGTEQIILKANDSLSSSVELTLPTP